jgi:hypothetical protein
MRRILLTSAVLLESWAPMFISNARAAPCLFVTLTGTQGGRLHSKAWLAPNAHTLWGR